MCRFTERRQPEADITGTASEQCESTAALHKLYSTGYCSHRFFVLKAPSVVMGYACKMPAQ